jgi:hypothetical protein
MYGQHICNVLNSVAKKKIAFETINRLVETSVRQKQSIVLKEKHEVKTYCHSGMSPLHASWCFEKGGSKNLMTTCIKFNK